MIHYVTLGTNDIERAAAFYDQLFTAMGAKRLTESERLIYWGKKMSKPMLAIARPYDGKPATVGNGTMVALGVRTRADVERLHARALELGAPDEGQPGPRGDGFYGAYFRDLDGNKLCVFTYELPVE